MSDEKANGSKTSARRAFRVKLSPGPTGEIIVLAADAVRAVELLGEKFDWKNIELSRIDEAQLIMDDPEEPDRATAQHREASRLRFKEKIEFLKANLEHCRLVATGERNIKGMKASQLSSTLSAVVELREKFDKTGDKKWGQEIKHLQTRLDLCRRAAKGIIIEDSEINEHGNADSFSAVLRLREKVDSVLHKNIGLNKSLGRRDADIRMIRNVVTGEVPAERVELGHNSALDAVVQLQIRMDATKGESNEVRSLRLRLETSLQREKEKHAEAQKIAREQQRMIDDLLQWLETIRRVAAGEGPILEATLRGDSSAALSAVVELREKFETFKATAYKPAPPGPVPTGPPGEVAKAGSEDQSPGGFAVLPVIIDDVETDPGTGNPEAMTGSGKPAEATGTGDAEEGDENNYMAPEVRQAGYGRLTDPDFARAPEPEEDEAPRYGELKWEFWRADTPMEDRTFYIARYADGDERAFVYWPTQGVLEVSQWDAITENCHIISSEVSERDLQVLNQKMKEKGYAP